MSYNLKNTRNGKSILKIPKWPSLRSLAGVSILNCSQKTGACQAECNGQLLGYSDNYLYKSLINSCPAFLFFYSSLSMFFFVVCCAQLYKGTPLS